MAHKGKNFPINQDWRVYVGNTDSLNGYPPKVMRFRTQFIVVDGIAFTSGAIIECFPLPWTPGAEAIAYSSATMLIAGHFIEIGAVGRLFPPGRMKWKLAAWDVGFDQLPLDWSVVLGGFAWHPGQTWLFVTDPVPPGTIWFSGLTEVWGKRWDEF